MVHAGVGWIVETLKYPTMHYIYGNNGQIRDLLSLMGEEGLHVQAGNHSKSTPLPPPSRPPPAYPTAQYAEWNNLPT